jgi:hypothetical protein
MASTLRQDGASRRSVLIGGASCGLVACSPEVLVPKAAFNYRLRVGIGVNGRERVGESIHAVEWRDNRVTGLPNAGVDFLARSWGEAVTIDLDEHGLLFGLLTGLEVSFKYPTQVSTGLFGARVKTAHPDREGLGFFAAISSIREELELPAQDRPLFVRFRDIQDPKTVERVDIDDLAATYGEGTKLKFARVQVTDERPRAHLATVAPTLAELVATRPPVSLTGRMGARMDASLADRLTGLDFMRIGE